MPTIAQQLSALITQKNALADNLNAMGVTASRTEKLNTLVPKVLEIETGIQFTEIAIPVVSGASTYTYDGTAKTLSFTGYDSDTMTLSGVTSAANAGTYQAWIVPKYEYKWTDGTYDLKAFNWTISKASPNLSVS